MTLAIPRGTTDGSRTGTLIVGVFFLVAGLYILVFNWSQVTFRGVPGWLSGSILLVCGTATCVLSRRLAKR
jgi:ABC-type transport system involved in cytochrome c biogenesis permease subunit